MNKPLWTPSKESIKTSNISVFRKFVNKNFGKKIQSYNKLYEWSVENPAEFWKSIWQFSEIIHSKKYNKILSSKKMFGYKWFTGANLNFAENLLRYRDDRIAIISSREGCPQIVLTYSQLYEKVAACTYGLKILGVKKGDRVAGFITNYPESIIAMLAATSLGALWSSCSPDFGIQGVLDRFGQIKPKVLFAIEEYQYHGKTIDCRQKIKDISKNIPEIKNIILIERFFDFSNNQSKSYNVAKTSKYIYFKDLIANTSKNIFFKQLPFDHPVYIMYSSGTTGIPKCIVHGAGGTLLQHFKEHSLHCNLTRDDVITYFTTCGWMMWNWLVSSLQIGATLFIYDGNPAYPNMNFLWNKIEEEKITVFGTSPKYLTLCQKRGLKPGHKHKLNFLKTILSTGSPLSAENFEWVYSNVKKDVQLSSISGGTDIISCFILGNPVLPVYSEEIQCRGLGMKVESFDEGGKAHLNKKGELVCTKPFPSMPIYFWNDKNNIKYKSAYFNKYPGIWHHGDFIKITRRGGVIVYGRSDATLNPGGVRIGTSEIYRIVESIPEVIDSIVIGQNYRNDVRIILFVVLNKNISLDKNLENKIKLHIRTLATPRHIPSKILQVTDVPRTISGKKVEIAVTRMIHGEKVKNIDVLANPDSLQQYERIREDLIN